MAQRLAKPKYSDSRISGKKDRRDQVMICIRRYNTTDDYLFVEISRVVYDEKSVQFIAICPGKPHLRHN